MEPETLLRAALEHVESASIRAWVDRQRGVWLEFLKSWRPAESGRWQGCDAQRLATYIVATAIGL